MAFIDFHKSVFFLESEIETTKTHENFHEIYKGEVKVIKQNDIQNILRIKSPNVVVLDIAANTFKTLNVLGSLLDSSERPRLIITTIANQIFRPDDILNGGYARILFKPFTLIDLAVSIKDIMDARNGYLNDHKESFGRQVSRPNSSL